MSKEIAQTVGGKKFGLLLVVLAALAVIATLGSQWQKSSATFPVSTATITQSATTANPGDTVTYTVSIAGNGVTTGTGVTVSLNFGVAVQSITPTPAGDFVGGTNGSNAATGLASYTSPAALTLATPANDSVAFAVKVGTASLPKPTITIKDSDNSTPGTVTDNTSALAVAGITANQAATCAVGTNCVVTVTIPVGMTWCSDDGANTPLRKAIQTSDVAVTGGTLVSATSQLSNATNATDTATITVADDTTPGVTVNVRTHLFGQAAGANCSTTASLITTSTAQAFLQHMVGANNATPATVQDIFNNVRGSLHVACVTDGNNNPLQIPITNLNQIHFANSGGYNTVGDQTPNTVGLTQFVGGGANPGLPNATCFSWISTGAGDQQITVEYPGPAGAITVGFNAASTVTNKSLIKEWNVLETSQVYSVSSAGAAFNTPLTATSGAGTNNVTYALSRGLTLNPSTGNNGFTTVRLTDAFLGSHTTSNGTKVTSGGASTSGISLAGVTWTVSLTAGSCGVLNVSNGTSVAPATGMSATFVGNSPTFNQANGTIDPASLPNVSLSAGTGSANCIMGSTATIVFTGQEPGPLASGAGNTVVETVVVSFTQSQPVKQVLLAWAGQNVVLEHDWRTPPGEQSVTSTTPVGTCPIPVADQRALQTEEVQTSQTVHYVKSGGPGAFISGIDGVTDSGNEAWVTISGSSQFEDAPLFPQDACISRALYESEDPGEVDVAAFFESDGLGNAASKVDFVIYYMKLNQVKLSLVNEVSKPTHNTTGSDYDPGNPWDATKDDADNTVDWNVSRDLLVRGRVTGWFINSNPSGRAADTSDPNNILPADRWVMPDDWARLAGGDKLANQFRKSYDLMFAPNNAAGIALASPTGSSVTVPLATVLAGSGTGTAASPILVNSTAGLLPFTGGSGLVVLGTTQVLICNAVSANAVTVQVFTFGANCGSPGGLTVAPAAGTLFTITSGAPFEGPYSLIDIPGFSGATGAGAALSNLGTTALFRDTTQGDGVVDWWDAPMPPAEISVSIRGTGFLKQVLKQDVYYKGTANSPATQTYPNPYYVQNIPASPYQAAVSAGAGYVWNSWGVDGPNTIGCTTSSFNPCSGGQGPYNFWTAAIVGTNGAGVGDSSVTAAQAAELAAIRGAYGDNTIARDVVVYSDNHGEFMVTANGDFKTDLTACAANALGGGKLCATGDKVGVGTITAVADYPEFVKHFPVASNAATVNWTWGGYKDVTVEPGETDQFKYVVFHAMDRDGFCSNAATGAVLLHPVLTSNANDKFNGNPSELVDFLIDSGDGIIVGSSNALGGVSGERGNLLGVPTFSVVEQASAAAPIKTFPLSSKAGADQKDECQAWIKISNSLLGVTNVLAIAHDDEGNIGFDRVIDLTGTTSYTLNFRWSLITWAGADNIPVADALKGGAGTRNPAGNDISAQVTAVYGWEQSSQTWLAFFPTGVNVPGANNLTALKLGQAYWIAIAGPGPVTWTVSTNVS